MAKKSDKLLVETSAKVAWITFNRPDRGNPLDEEMLDALTSSIEEFEEADRIRCVVLQGAGKRFSVGMDLHDMAKLSPEANSALVAVHGPLRRAIHAIETFKYPVIAKISGYAVGAACELALACDLRAGCFASCMGTPPSKLGLVYPPEGLARFASVLGFPTAKKLFLTAGYFYGQELYDMGMIDYLIEDEKLDGFTAKLARTTSTNAPRSQAGHKYAFRKMQNQIQLDPEFCEEMDTLISEAFSSTDAVEGLKAFLEKRPPRFS